MRKKYEPNTVDRPLELSEAEVGMRAKLPDEPDEMRHWRKVIERWDSLEAEVYHKAHPPDDWTAEEWNAMSKKNREEILAHRQSSFDAALTRLVSFAARLNGPGTQLRSLAEDAEKELLLDCRDQIEAWLRDRNGRPWVVPETEDLDQMETDARAAVRAKEGNAKLKSIASHIVHQMFPNHGYDKIRKL